MSECITNIIIPMAGEGRRFKTAGFNKPKPFIDVLGKPMICHVLENLDIKNSKFILIARKEHLEFGQEIFFYIKKKYNADFILIDKLTQGACCTVLYAHRLINNSNPLLIANSDQIVDIDIEDYINDSNKRDLDGSVLCFKDDSTKWSYAKLNDEGYITEIREKEVISPFATVGIYYYKRGSDFVNNAIDMIIEDDRVNNEFYTAPVYNYAIRHQKKFDIFEIDKNQMHGPGTPEDLEKFIQFKKGQS